MVRVITVDSHGFLYLVSRNEWMAREPLSHSLVKRPFNRVVFTLTGTAECNNRSDCITQLRLLQEKHMAEGRPDIKSSFFVGGYGTVYEGRGWKYLTDLGPGEQHGRLEIGLVGDFATNSSVLKPPPYEMLSSALTLVKYGLKNGFIHQDYKVSYHLPQTANKINVYNI